mmetsp:Transcript_26577/g.36779  ORF Transcript_26577/g.36779 Transcript_26577/m.36779 type:complete len:994 (+) Transcript_26577:188-3169(+)
MDSKSISQSTMSDHSHTTDVVVKATPAEAAAKSYEKKIPISTVPLSKEQVKQRYGVYKSSVCKIREKFGANVIKEEKSSKLAILLRQFTGTMPVMIEIAMVLTAVLEKWIDFAIIAAMLLINAGIGFHHENSAKAALAEVESKLTANEKVQAFRKADGGEIEETDLKVEEVIVGELIYVRAGDVIPADAEWVHGDKLFLNKASLTGETRPIKVPEDEKNVFKGSTLIQGEGFVVVTAVGEHTMQGEASKAMSSSEQAASPLQKSIQGVVNWLVAVTIVIVFFILIIQLAVRGKDVRMVLLAATGLIIAAVPVALPMVVTVTLAIGATELAKQGAIIAHLSAMQDLASMDVLCSDKTGTLTTAKMTISLGKIWVNEAIERMCSRFSKANVVELAALCSTLENAKKNEIECSVFEALEEVKDTDAAKFYSNYHCDISKGDVYFGFNANVKRTYCTLSRSPQCGCESKLPEKLKISKGLLTKVLNNKSSDDDSGEVQWVVQDYDIVGPIAMQIDEKFGRAGYKTLAVVADIRQSAGSEVHMSLVGILPIKDPPRASTEETIEKIRHALINVKMVTGDHENIARNLAADIHLGGNFLVHDDLWPASALRDEKVENMDGIAQVTPKDKHEVVSVLQRRGHVVGMCGDGVNDAPALKLANVGFAVPGATQAARNAADIVLTDSNEGKSEGLEVIYDAIAISREIFQRIQAYVLYRFASTVLIIIFLAVLTFAFSADFPALYVILLAIINDVTVVPICTDKVVGTKGPSALNMLTVLGLSCVIGGLLAVQAIMTYWGNPFGLNGMDAEEVAVYLQISVASQFMIFICRTEKPFFLTIAPHWLLVASCSCAQLLVSLWCGLGVVVAVAIPIEAIVYIWLYSLAGLLVVDMFKCEYYYLMDPDLHHNLYYTWVLDLIWCRKLPTKRKAALPRLPRRTSPATIPRDLTGLYLRKDHVGNLTLDMQTIIRRSMHTLRSCRADMEAREEEKREYVVDVKESKESA